MFKEQREEVVRVSNSKYCVQQTCLCLTVEFPCGTDKVNILFQPYRGPDAALRPWCAPAKQEGSGSKQCFRMQTNDIHV